MNTDRSTESGTGNSFHINPLTKIDGQTQRQFCRGDVIDANSSVGAQNDRLDSNSRATTSLAGSTESGRRVRSRHRPTRPSPANCPESAKFGVRQLSEAAATELRFHVQSIVPEALSFPTHYQLHGSRSAIRGQMALLARWACLANHRAAEDAAGIVGGGESACRTPDSALATRGRRNHTQYIRGERSAMNDERCAQYPVPSVRVEYRRVRRQAAGSARSYLRRFCLKQRSRAERSSRRLH